MALACPKCSKTEVWPSMHRRWERLLALVRLNPFRCQACYHRFFVFRSHGESWTSKNFTRRSLAGRYCGCHFFRRAWHPLLFHHAQIPSNPIFTRR